MKLIAIDIGNTSIHAAVHNGRRWVREYRLSSRAERTKRERFLSAIFRTHADHEAMIASVVPPLGRAVRSQARKALKGRVCLVGADLAVPVRNLYRNPKKVGVDRLLNAYAAYRRYRRDLIVIDFGTAITFDVVSKKGEYLGGVIAPGIELSLDALFERTALLPKIRLQHPREIIGRDTVSSIRIGCSVGVGGLCDRMVEAIRRERGSRMKVIATGGYASFMKKYCRSIDQVRPKLVLEALYEICLTKRDR